MTQPLTRRLALVIVLALGAPELSASNQSRPTRWWKSDAIARELGLTTEQSARIDHIWETTVPELRQEWEALEGLESKLSRMIEANVDEAMLARQIDRVETARANASKTRSLMLYRMRQVLTPEQRVLLKSLQQQRSQRGGRSQIPPEGGQPKAPPGSRPGSGSGDRPPC